MKVQKDESKDAFKSIYCCFFLEIKLHLVRYTKHTQKTW